MILACVTMIINLTSVWTDRDQEHLDMAKVRCQQIYPDAPCVKKFIKVKKLTYRVVCGL